MAVPCRGCGREYDVTLFEFGRTIWCRCGRRVGLEARRRSLGSGASRRFLADAMLGKLARWLRLLGFDCAYQSDIEDSELVRRAVREDRVILSRDRSLPAEWWVSGIYVVHGETVWSQLVEVCGRFHLGEDVQPFSRCAECNLPLQRADRTSVCDEVPQGVLERRSSFTRCPGCGRVYWEGSHTERIQRLIDRLLAAA